MLGASGSKVPSFPVRRVSHNRKEAQDELERPEVVNAI